METKKTDLSPKEIVIEKYSEIATQSRTENATSCCGAGCACGETDIMAEDYTISGWLRRRC